MKAKALLFIPVALAQLTVPALMIRSHEVVMREGESFKFRTAPIDPLDPFRGEYVRLDFAAESGEWTYQGTTGQEYRSTVFGALAVDSNGFAKVTTLSDVPPAGPYVSVDLSSSLTQGERVGISRIALPFDRFYLEEGEGSRTEDLFVARWEEGRREEPKEAYALVRVLDGKAVIEDLIVGGRPISEWMKEDAPPGE